MKSSTDKYKQKVFRYLDDMPEGTRSLSALCKPETKTKFVQTVKDYINERQKDGQYNGYVIELSSDYSKLIKFEVIL